MALYTLKEFGELCGMKKAALSNAKARGQFFADDKKMVDTSLPINSLFLEKRLAKRDAPPPPMPSASPAAPGGQPDDRPEGELQKLERRKKALDVERAENDLELSEIKKQKMRGEVIPTAVIRIAFQQLFNGFTVSFKQAVENLITEFTQTAHLNRNQQADLRKKLVKILNHGIDKGISEAQDLIDNTVMEFRRDQ